MSIRQETVNKITQSNVEVSTPDVLGESLLDQKKILDVSCDTEVNAAKLPICHAQYTQGNPVVKKLSWNEEKQQLNPTEQHASVIGKVVENVEDTLYGLREKFMDKDSHDYCLSLGVAHNTVEYSLKNDVDRKLPIGETVLVKSKDYVESYGYNFIARTNDLIKYVSGSAYMYFDIDGHVKSLEEVKEKLNIIDPQLEGSAMLIVHSSSSMLRCGDIPIKGPRFHIYVAIDCGTDVPAYKEYFIERSWLKGFGNIKVSSSGSILLRSFVDESVFDGGRINYETPPILDDHLTRDVPDPQVINGSFVSLTNCLTVSDDEKKTVAGLKEIAKKAPEILEESGKKKKKYIAKEGKKIMKKTGVSRAEAEAIVNKLLESSILESAFVITFDDNSEVTVEEILREPDKYNGRLCRDPLEPDYDNGRIVGKVFVNGDGTIVICSFARGGRHFFCEHGRLPILTHIEWINHDIKLTDKNFVGCVAVRAWDYHLKNSEVSTLVVIGMKRFNSLKGMKVELREMIRCIIEEKTMEAAETEIEEIKRSIDDGSWVPLEIDNPDVRLNLGTFTHIDDTGKVLKTHWNLDHFFKLLGIAYHYNAITKAKVMDFNSEGRTRGDSDELATGQMAIIMSVCNLNGIPEKLIQMLPALNLMYYKNPVLDYLTGLPAWDGIDRLEMLTDDGYVEVNPEYRLFAKVALRKCFIQACAAADKAERAIKQYEAVHNTYPVRPIPKFESVLVFQSGQGVSKTEWIASLLPESLKDCHKRSLSLNPDDKDSVKRAISCWIAELGELDSTFKQSDISKLKAFMSETYDELRLPYDAVPNRYPRQTVYFATVNDHQFLTDGTGNRRFWVLGIKNLKLIPPEMLDQLWAQAWHLYTTGHTWWLSPDEEVMRDELNKTHMMRNDYSDNINFYFSPGNKLDDKSKFLSYKIMKDILGINNVNESRFKKALKVEDFLTDNVPETCYVSGVRGKGRWVVLNEQSILKIKGLIAEGRVAASYDFDLVSDLNMCS